jgi:DNA invertase Pin-like site-specific DNA recombinase
MGSAEPASGRRATIRCAIYARKSSEDGLEQDFNSLHAQREACEAYIKSQLHEGWRALPELYDDGGISGATMDRPALRQLLTDITADKIDTVVVYKVDRLTRSLADFAKIVDIFDAHHVAFVSVTQQFNTTTSMGRLTLNVLLSFAQFEREVIGERIRDKIAASKRKGMWMGGTPPLGYDARHGKLVVNAAEAATVRHIFGRYAALGSVRLLQRELDAAGIVSKRRVTTAGRHWGGSKLARGALYLMLQNRIYRGQIVHKDRHYPGEHPPIVEPDLWDRVQARLAENAVDRGRRGGCSGQSLLVGLISDGNGNRMSPTHAVKDGKRYRYYVSRPLITEGRVRVSSASRIPAAEIERLVADRLRAFLADDGAVFDAVRTRTEVTSAQKQRVEQAAALAAAWPELPPARQSRLVRALVSRVVVADDQVRLELAPAQIVTILAQGELPERAAPAPGSAEEPVILSIPVRLQRIGHGTKLIVRAANRSQSEPNPNMVRLLAQAHQLYRRLLQSRLDSIAAVASQEQMTGSYITRLIRLVWLAPDVTQAILTGRQPPALTASTLIRTDKLPMDWQQRRVLGFV